MTFFRKTLAFFVGAIAFQSVLTVVLVTNATRGANLADARRTLESEAVALYDSFNDWKRQLWISLIAAMNDGELARAVARGPSVPLKERLLETKADAVFIRRSAGSVAGFEQVAPGTLELRDLEGLSNELPHPYIELLVIRGSLDLVGVAGLALPGGGRADLFLIKRVDDEFAAQLVSGRASAAVFLRGRTVLAGSLPGRAGPDFFDPRLMDSAYREFYGQRVAGASYNAAFQRLGMLDHEQAGEELFLGTLLSNGPYDEKLFLLDRTILIALLAAALLTVVLSLFLSRNITRPVGQLLGAMGRLGSGALETTLPPVRGGNEIGRLFRGFNDMAAELARNREAVTRALRETRVLKEYNEKIVDSIRAGIAIVNRELVVEKANDAFIEAFGLDRSRVIGAPLTNLDMDVVDEAVVERIFAVFRGEPVTGRDIKRSRSGRVFEIRLYPFYSSAGSFQESSGCVFMADDISAKTRLEERIFQAEKLATVSMLSAGTAHEINNPLGSILTTVQNLIDDETDPGRRVSLKWIEQETRRIARIVQGLLNFASTGAAGSAGADVNEVVRETVALVTHSVAREGRVQICTRLAPHLPPTAIGTDELRQVAINLLSNAIQAIRGPGRILITTHPARRGRIPLAVADTGVGIARQNVPRIFDPFFTTKPTGDGTGLGLSVVYGIVTKHGGTIDVRSAEGRGTRFCLALPVREKGA